VRERDPAVAVIDELSFGRPEGSDNVVIETLQWTVDLRRLDVQGPIRPQGQYTSRTQHAVCFGVEAGQVKPVRRLRHGHEINRVVAQAAAVGFADTVRDPWMRPGAGDLLRA